MHIVQVDESGTINIHDKTNLFVIGSVIFHEDQLDEVKNHVDQYKNNNFTWGSEGSRNPCT